MMRPHRHLSLAALAMLLLPHHALAKGYGGAELSASADNTAELIAALSLLLQENPCPAPTPADCLSANYGLSTCGRNAAQVLIDWDAGACEPTCDSYAPSVDDCQEAAFLNSVCGQAERHRMAIPDDYPTVDAPHPSTCVNLLRDFGEMAQSNSPIQSVFDVLPIEQALVPSATVVPLGPDQNPTIDDENILAYGYADAAWPTEARPQLGPSYQEFTTDGTGMLFSSKVAHDDIGLRGPNAANYAANFFVALRTGWDTNGNAAESCREYAYEKNYDYSQWEDRAHFLGADARAKVQAAYDDVNEPWAIGSRQLLEPPIRLRRKDGVQTYPQLWFGSGDTQKNELFRTAVHVEAAERQDRIDNWTDNGNTVQFTYKGETYSGVTIHPVDLLHPVILDDDLYAVLADGRANHRVTKNWAWHQQMNDAMTAAGFLDEQLFAMDRLKDRYAWMLHRRNSFALYTAYEIARAYGLELDDTLIEQGLTDVFNPAELINPVDDFLDLDAFSQAFQQVTIQEETRNTEIEVAAVAALPAALGVINLGGLTADIPGGTTTMAYSQTSGVGPTVGGSTFAGVAALLATKNADLFSVEPQRGENKWERLIRLTQQVAIMDYALENYLRYADSYGCLDLEGTNPCDWSPDVFVNRLVDAVATAREADYQRCLQYTAEEGFEQLYEDPAFLQNRFYIDVPPTQKYAGTSTFTCNLPDYHLGTDDIELYFKCVDVYRQQLIMALDVALTGGGVTLDPETNDVKISDNVSDSDWLGGGAFGVGYDYAGRWSVTGLKAAAGELGGSPDWCQLKPHLHGHFDVEARAMYADVDLFSASGDVGLDPGEPAPNGYIEVVGQTLIDVGDDDVPTPNAFHVIIDETKEKKKTFFSVRATVMVGPVPLTLKAGMAGRIGTNFQLAVGSGPGSGGAGCDDGGSVLSAVFGPFASVDAFASASLDAVIVEAGVKISLVIVGLSFPFTTTLRTEGQLITNNVLDVRLSAESTLDVVFYFLSGRVSAFVKFCFILCETIEATIFEWDGLRSVTRLVDTNFSVPLRPLAKINPPSPGGP